MSEQLFPTGKPQRPAAAYLQATRPWRDTPQPTGKLISDIVATQPPRPPVQPLVQRPAVPAGPPRQQPSAVLKREFVQPPSQPANPAKSRYSIAQKVMMGMAGMVFIVGLAVSAQTLQTNHAAGAQVTALAKRIANQDDSGNGAFPSTVKPSQQAINQYQVAPDMARYLVIPKLQVKARVMQAGVTTSGALSTPDDVYDTAWYTGSAKPGQPGATVIDGHVSSWTTHGVFYNLKQLGAGDTIQIIRGDGSVVNYQVVKTQIYNSNSVNMAAALTPITAGKSGLNLISCTGQVKPGTSEFNERVIVFAQQI